MANDEPDLQEETVVRGDHYYYGSKTGLIYSGHLPITSLYHLPSFLKVVFAFTPDYRLMLSQEYNIYEIELESLPPYQMELLFHRFMDLYQGVYQLAMPRGDRRQLFDLVKAHSYQSTRRFIKAMVECQDFFRFYPRENLSLLVSHASSGKAF